MDKQHILDEIRRTARANNGVALGRQRFETETGVKYWDWYGKFWTRWSDAVREAGLKANRMAEAFDDEFLLEKLVGLTRQLGRVPAQGDVLMARRRDPAFPSEKTFRRFGSKAQRIGRVVAYCDASSGRDDVANLWRQIPAQRGEDREIARAQEVFGFVYLTKSGRFYKIGKTNAAGRRERELAIQLPEKTSTVHVIKTDDPSGIEAYWHNRFAPKRQHGEWFTLSSNDVRAFKRRKFM
jgi:Meiotically up-regulated gene 113